MPNFWFPTDGAADLPWVPVYAPRDPGPAFDPGRGGGDRSPPPPVYEAPSPPDEPAPPPAPEPVVPEVPQEPVPEVVVSAPAPQPVLPILTAASPAMLTLTITGARPAPRRRPAPKPRPRRSKPAPKPSRRARPTTRPRPGGPRIPIPLPAVGRALLSRVLPILSLVPAYLATLAKIDNFGTQGWYDRIYGVGYDPRSDQRSGNLGPGTPRDRAAPQRLPEVVVSATRPLDTVTVTGRKPSRVAAPQPVFQPAPLPGLGFTPFEVPDAPPSPTRSPRRVNEPAPQPAPNPFAPGVPELAPAPAPEFSPAPAPQPRPSALPRPDISPMPGPGLNTPFQPALAPEPAPAARADPCDCAKKKGKDKKPKKKQKDREKCFRGTYYEKRRGLSKYRKEQIDCTTGKPINQPRDAANEEF